jgi:hypothetical protein
MIYLWLYEWESILGPLFNLWRIQRNVNFTGYQLLLFWNSEADCELREDLRIGDLPAGLEKVKDDCPYRNSVTGE